MVKTSLTAASSALRDLSQFSPGQGSRLPLPAHGLFPQAAPDRLTRWAGRRPSPRPSGPALLQDQRRNDDAMRIGIVSIGDVIKHRLEDLELTSNFKRDVYATAH